jgi:aminotransferase class V
MLDVESLRAQTPGCLGRIHPNNAGAALLAQPTLNAMTSHLRLEAEIGGYEAAGAAKDAIAATYDAIAELIGGQSEEIALFDNATHAWNAAFYSVPLRPGDRILTGRAEYGSNVLAYLQGRRAGRRPGRPRQRRPHLAHLPDTSSLRPPLAAQAHPSAHRSPLLGTAGSGCSRRLGCRPERRLRRAAYETPVTLDDEHAVPT